MKTLKTKFFALAFLALGFSALTTSCGKDDEKGEPVDFEGTYYGEHVVMSLLPVPDTLTIRNIDATTIGIYSVKLDKEFEAKVNGNKASIDSFEADKFVAGENEFTGVKVESGTATLTDNKKLKVELKNVSVDGGPEDLPINFPIKGATITTSTSKPFLKQ